MNTYIYAGGSSLLTMKDYDQNCNMKDCECCKPCVTGA